MTRGSAIMFRAHDGRIVDRARVTPSEIKPGQWMLLKGSAKSPAHAATADFDVFARTWLVRFGRTMSAR